MLCTCVWIGDVVGGRTDCGEVREVGEVGEVGKVGLEGGKGLEGE